MATEIEHKFAVKNDSYKSRIEKKFGIIQGYLSRDKDRTVRVRIIGDEAFLTIKGITIGCSRSEFEYPIPVSDALIIIEDMCLKPLIEKTRNIVMHDGDKWEIDEFHGDMDGLVLAEIEIPYKEYKYSIPSFVGENVTNNPLYYNSNIGNPDLKYK